MSPRTAGKRQRWLSNCSQSLAICDTGAWMFTVTAFGGDWFAVCRSLCSSLAKLSAFASATCLTSCGAYVQSTAEQAHHYRTTTPAARATLSLAAYGCSNRVQPAATGSDVGDGASTAYGRQDIVEWYERNARGVEHGFTLERSLCADGDTELDVAVNGFSPRLASNGLDAEFLDERGSARMHYTDLRAWAGTFGGRRWTPALRWMPVTWIARTMRVTILGNADPDPM